MATTPNVNDATKKSRSGTRLHKPARPNAVTTEVAKMTIEEDTRIQVPGSGGPPTVK
jgi:hypothetical protein